MQFLKDLNTFHIDGKEIPCIAASGAPDDHYPGATGVLYMDSSTGKLYLCTGANTIQKKYFWRIVGDVDAAEVRQAVEDYMGENPVSGGGLSTTAANLLVEILRNGVYSADQSANITVLAEALTVTEPDTPDVPDVPDDPDAVIYTVTNNLTNVVTSNAVTSVTEGAGYAATLAAADGYELDAVTVTMGGVDITSTVYLDGTVSIATVSGDIVITATAKAEPVEMAIHTRINDAGNTAIYSDGGEAQISKGYTTYTCSKEAFAEDTEVTVTIETSGRMFSIMYAGCYQLDSGFPVEGPDPNNKSVEKSIYYAEILFNAATEVDGAGTYTKPYTVKAGYGLVLVNPANTVAPVTGVTVTK